MYVSHMLRNLGKRINVVDPFFCVFVFFSILIYKNKTMTNNTTVHTNYFKHGLE